MMGPGVPGTAERRRRHTEDACLVAGAIQVGSLEEQVSINGGKTSFG